MNVLAFAAGSIGVITLVAIQFSVYAKNESREKTTQFSNLIQQFSEGEPSAPLSSNQLNMPPPPPPDV
jgi:hypothetical protein